MSSEPPWDSEAGLYTILFLAVGSMIIFVNRKHLGKETVREAFLGLFLLILAFRIVWWLVIKLWDWNVSRAMHFAQRLG